MTTTVAAIDCGTNSVRLLVRSASGQTLARLMRITRLGKGVDATGKLDPEAIERTVAVLREYQSVIERFGVSKVRMTATSAARDATNRDEFFDAVRDITGTTPELLSGAEEGRLSFAGAVSDVSSDLAPFLVVDIGGGSTEFSVGRETCESTMSIDVGCVRLSEKYLHHDPPLPEELLACISVTDVFLDDVAREMPGISDVSTFVGLAGTITTAAAVEMGLPEYDHDRIHHFRLTKAAAEDVFRTLATESYEERVENPGLERERADVIVGGLCVLVAIMRRFGFEECLVSEADILDGLAMSIAD